MPRSCFIRIAGEPNQVAKLIRRSLGFIARRYWHEASADSSTEHVERSANARPLTKRQRWSIALSSGVAHGKKRNSIPRSAAVSRLSSAV